MNILIILYTLCNTPQYYTLIDNNRLLLIEANPENTIAIYEKYKDTPIDYATLPLDKVNEGKCS